MIAKKKKKKKKKRTDEDNMDDLNAQESDLRLQ